MRLYFDNLLKLDNSEWADFEKCIVKVKISKNEQILKQGEYCNFIAFIHEGSFRFFKTKTVKKKSLPLIFKVILLLITEVYNRTAFRTLPESV